MREWLTAQEIADEALPTMPATKMGMKMLAERNAWDLHPSFARKRVGRGGGMEYHYHILPVLAQTAYLQKHMRVGGKAPAEAPPATAGDTLRAATEREARLAILAAFRTFSRELTLGDASRVQIFTDKYNAGRITVDAWVREAVPALSKRSLARWRKAQREGRTGALGFDRSASRKGTGSIDRAEGGRLRAHVLGLLAAYPHLSASQIRTECEKEFGATVKSVSRGIETTIPLPPLRTFQEAIKAIKASHEVELLKLTNPDKFRSTMAPAGTGALRHVTEPNQLWQIDASPMDALCTDGRHAVYCCIDIATRRTIWHLSRTASAAAVGFLIRKAILAWGVPDEIKTDNGSDFVAQQTKGLLLSLGVEMDLSEAYSPEQKGHVERAIRTMQHGFAALLPGYVGHSVADRKAIESRKAFSKRLGESEAETFEVSLTGAEMQDRLDRWAATAYAHKQHAGLKGRSPFEVAAASTKPLRTVDVRALDILLMPLAGNGLRTVTRQGIRVDHHFYQTPTILPGREVMVRMDPADLGRVLAFDPDSGAFLGEAICPELAGADPAEQTRLTKELQGAMVHDATVEIKRTVREIRKKGPLVDRALSVAEAKHGNVVALPKRTETHTTPQIAAALDAASDRRAEADGGLDPRAAAEQVRMIEEMTREEFRDFYDRTEAVIEEKMRAIAERATAHVPEGVAKLPESPKQRYRRWYQMRQARERGEVGGTVDDGIWFARYEQSAEWRAQAALHEDFGEAYLGP